MHLGTGEEAVAAGIVTYLGDGDGLALTHPSMLAGAGRAWRPSGADVARASGLR
jgi:hypothetical protein